MRDYNQNDSLTLYNAVNKYAAGAPARFHMPGHKGTLSPFDVTELSCTDNLHQPGGEILTLEKRCAKAFGAREALLLVNGSTAGNIGMLLALGEAKRVLLGRNCHKSVLSGIALAGHDTLPLFPDKYGVIAPDMVKTALEAAKSPVSAVFITSPTYTGHCCDIAGIAKTAHTYGALLFVDCAHGAHFPFSEMLPKPPVEADAWVISCHKTLNAMTQSAVLNIGQSCPISATDMRRYVSLVQSTSPSYPLMLSIENAIESTDGWTQHCIRIGDLRCKLKAIPNLTLTEIGDAYSFDITRLTLSVCNLSGYELAALLESKAIFVEMADLHSVVLITSPKDPEEWYNRLEAALTAICSESGECATVERENTPVSTYGERVADIRRAMLGNVKRVPLNSAAGRVAVQAVGVYPPGVATLFPGERITHAAVDMLLRQVRLGAALFGAMDGDILVVDEERG